MNTLLNIPAKSHNKVVYTSSLSSSLNKAWETRVAEVSMPMSKKTTKKTEKTFNVQLNTNRLHYNTTTPTTTGPVVEATKDEVDLSRFKGKR